MMGSTHYALGAVAGLALALHTDASAADGALTILVAAGTAHGWLSPDMDQAPWWRWLDRWLPDEMLGDGGPLQHRGITHFWLWPVLLWLAAPFAPWPLVVQAVAVGWGSHVAGDFMVGARSRNRGPGVPLLGWRWHVGVGARCGGWVEQVIGKVGVPVAAAWLLAPLAGVQLPDVVEVVAALT